MPGFLATCCEGGYAAVPLTLPFFAVAVCFEIMLPRCTAPALRGALYRAETT